MDIKLKQLEWSWMFSYGEKNVLRLDQDRVSQLVGVNGIGKTTISLIIQELLYSKNLQGIKKGDILNREGSSKGWFGKLDFSVNDIDYCIKVDRVGDTSKVKLYQGADDISEHKIPDTYKKIEQILGKSFEVFCQQLYQSTTDILDFVKATDTNRKKFLINLFRLERYLEEGERIKATIGETERTLSEKQGELRSINLFLDSNKILEKKNLVTVPQVDNSLQLTLSDLNRQIESYNSIASKVNQNLKLIQERNSLKFDIGLILPENPGADTKINALNTNIALLNHEIADIVKKVSSINTSDTCYACGQGIDNHKSVALKQELKEKELVLRTKLKDANSELEQAKQLDNTYKIDLTKYNTNKQAINRFEQLSQLINTELVELPKYDDLISKQKEISMLLTTQQKAYEEANKLNEQIKNHNTKIDILAEQKREFLARRQLLEESIISVQSKISNLTILKKAFSTSGIVAYKLENLTKQLEDTINYYLAELSDGKFSISFKLSGDKLNIVLEKNGKVAPIETASRGEFGRIQTAILLSIRNILSKLGGSRINVLFLDEITGALDRAGKERLVEILLQEEGSNIFFISHDFDHPLMRKIEIIKENEISKIRQEI